MRETTTKNKQTKDWRGGVLLTMNFSPLPSLPPIDQTKSFPWQGNWYIFSTLWHNARTGWCRCVGKIGINFAPAAFVNAKTSHGPECGWLTQCQRQMWSIRSIRDASVGIPWIGSGAAGKAAFMLVREISVSADMMIPGRVGYYYYL